MADDTTKGGSGEFDDWLEEQPGPPSDPTNPYKDLTEDDADEIAEWMAFTGGSSAPDESQPIHNEQAPGASEQPSGDHGDDDQPVDDETGEIEPVPVSPQEPEQEPEPDPVADAGSSILADDDRTEPDEPVEMMAAPPDPDDMFNEVETVEIDAVEMSAYQGGMFGLDPVDGDDPLAAPFDIETATEEAPSPAVETFSSDTAWSLDDDASDDTGDLEIVPAVPIVGFGSQAEDEQQVPEEIPPESRELFDLSEADYVSTATTEHSDLADAIASASAHDTEQVPIAAPIPGMTDTVVGFEDVVEAEGIGRVRARASGDLVARAITGVVLIAALGASLLWRPALAVFALAIFVLGAGEFYTSLVRGGHKPIAIFGFIGIISASVGAYFWGAVSIPVAFFIAVALLLLYYAVVPGKKDPLGNLSLTITVMVWVGLGSYTMLIATSDSYRPLVLGTVVLVAAMDIGQYFVGRGIGRTPLARWVSPKKTVEGLVGGVIIALALGALLHFVSPFELTSGLALGVAVAILVPLGDLAMSAAKRTLGLKDMGSVLPGHGGFLDRIDGLLFVIPAAWVIFLWAGIL